MVMVDNAEAIRRRAYALWEEAGRPNGHEHQHWAQARRELTVPEPEPERADRQPFAEVSEFRDVEVLRRELYTPCDCSTDLLQRDAPLFGLARQRRERGVSAGVDRADAA